MATVTRQRQINNGNSVNPMSSRVYDNPSLSNASQYASEATQRRPPPEVSLAAVAAAAAASKSDSSQHQRSALVVQSSLSRRTDKTVDVIDNVPIVRVQRNFTQCMPIRYVWPFSKPQLYPYLSKPNRDPDPERKEFNGQLNPNSQCLVPCVDPERDYGCDKYRFQLHPFVFVADYSFDGEIKQLALVAEANQYKSWKDAMHSLVPRMERDHSGELVEVRDADGNPDMLLPVPGYYRPAYPLTVHNPDHLLNDFRIVMGWQPSNIAPEDFNGTNTLTGVNSAINDLITQFRASPDLTLHLTCDSENFAYAFGDSEWDHQYLHPTKQDKNNANSNKHAILYQMAVVELDNSLGLELDMRISSRSAFDPSKRVMWSHRTGVNGLYKRPPADANEPSMQHRRNNQQDANKGLNVERDEESASVIHVGLMKGHRIQSADGQIRVYDAPACIHDPQFHQLIHSWEHVEKIKQDLATFAARSTTNTSSRIPTYLIDAPQLNPRISPDDAEPEDVKYGGLKAASLIQYLVMTNWRRIIDLCDKMGFNEEPAKPITSSQDNISHWRIPIAVFDVIVEEIVNRFQIEKQIICFHDFAIDLRPLRGEDGIRWLQQQQNAYKQSVNQYDIKFPSFAVTLGIVMEPYRPEHSPWSTMSVNRY